MVLWCNTKTNRGNLNSSGPPWVQAPLRPGPGSMYPLKPPLAGPGYGCARLAGPLFYDHCSALLIFCDEPRSSFLLNWMNGKKIKILNWLRVTFWNFTCCPESAVLPIIPPSVLFASDQNEFFREGKCSCASMDGSALQYESTVRYSLV